MKNRLVTVVFILFSTISFLATAAPTSCKGSYYDDQRPDINNNEFKKNDYELCYIDFAVIYSGVTQTPLWSAEHLTKDGIYAAYKIKRRNTFHEEKQVPYNMRSRLSDYSHSGFDRGHMSPSGDMSSSKAQYQSFTLSNMVPQNPNDNRELWEGIEAATRHLAIKYGNVYVISGPIFKKNFKKLKGYVGIPSQLFKLIYIPSINKAGVYLVNNKSGMWYEKISISQLDKITGYVFLKNLSSQVKNNVFDLPTPRPHHFR